MEHADTILTNGIVVTLDAHDTVYESGAIAVREGSIVGVGPSVEIMGRFRSDETIDCAGQFIMPGLINAHTHVPMTLLRALADDLRLDVWLMGYIMPVEREFVDEAFCRLGTALGCAEMIRGGVTAFADMYYFEDAIAEVTAGIGMRALLGQTILKFPAPDAGSYVESLEAMRRFADRWRGHPLIIPAIAPHGPYATTPDILRACAELAQAHQIPIHTHIAETQREVEDNLATYGRTVVPYMKDTGLLKRPLIAAHCVHIDEHEMRMLQKAGAVVSHNPTANLKLASGIAPVARMLELGVTVAIGTDGPGSNNDLDMFEEMRLAALIAKVNPPDPTAVTARQALKMATINGAKALGIDAIAGSLEVGKSADVITVDARPIHNLPRFRFNPESVYSQLVYASKASDVQDVMVMGRWLMRDRSLLTVDLEVMQHEIDAYAERVGQFLTTREQNVLSKLVTVSADIERDESFEVQVKAVMRHPERIEDLLSAPEVTVEKASHYRQFDTYLLFDDEGRERVRYREDDVIDAVGQVGTVRQRLTYIAQEKESLFDDAVVLSRSRFFAPASHPLRFYREYFGAPYETFLQKERRRWHVNYKGTLFYVNLDKLVEPELPGWFVEIKSRTWSRGDAEQKAHWITEMLAIIGVTQEDIVRGDYLDIAR
jgi:5-methylthioadenosine/S-adenosylhomocysteine deaminase